MQTDQIWANLAVADTKRTEAFYTALGFTPNCDTTPVLTSFLFGKNNFVIHFFIKKQLEFAMNGKTTDLQHSNEVIFSLSAKSEAEVDAWAAKVAEAGGTIVTEAGRQSDGYYYCVFADPDGHKFNVLCVEPGM